MEPLSANDPRSVGEFQLRARLGAGGMGRVYLGYSPAGRAVAVKVVHSELARDAEFRHRFGREVAAARAVGGMYTAPVVAAGLDDDPPWLATAYVPGPPLANVVARHGALPELAVWRLGAGLAEALRAVHACGLVHRDLKPANVLLAADGPHVIDFGISRAFDGTQLTAVGMVVGTPGYMSPEQAEGALVGPASDVFSLGCVLAFAASGNAPFGGGSAASVLYRVVTGRPDLTSVPEKLREVISACLAKDPKQRPELAALGAMITRAGPAVTATPTSFWPAEVAEVIEGATAAPASLQSAGAAASAPAGMGAAASGTLAAASGMTGAGPGGDRTGASRLAGRRRTGRIRMTDAGPAAAGGSGAPGRRWREQPWPRRTDRLRWTPRGRARRRPAWRTARRGQPAWCRTVTTPPRPPAWPRGRRSGQQPPAARERRDGEAAALAPPAPPAARRGRRRPARWPPGRNRRNRTRSPGTRPRHRTRGAPPRWSPPSG